MTEPEPQDSGPQYPAPQHSAPAPEHPQAIVVLVIGLIASIGGILTCGLTAPFGPVAWIFGRRVIRQIDSGTAPAGGREKAVAGYWMGIIATAVMTFILLGVIVLVALFFMSPTPGS